MRADGTPLNPRRRPVTQRHQTGVATAVSACSANSVAWLSRGHDETLRRHDSQDSDRPRASGAGWPCNFLARNPFRATDFPAPFPVRGSVAEDLLIRSDRRLLIARVPDQRTGHAA